MLCHLSRWLISRAEDGGRPLPRFVERHAGRCPACRDYARFTASLGSRLSQEARPFLAAVPDFSLGPPVGGAGLRPGRVFLRPLPVAASVLVVAAAAVVLFRLVPRPDSISPQDREKALAALKTVTAAPGQFEGAIEGAESTLAGERAILEESILSAVAYLGDRLNIKVVRREPVKRL